MCLGLSIVALGELFTGWDHDLFAQNFVKLTLDELAEACMKEYAAGSQLASDRE